ncbi:MAG: hypothetical protein ACXWIU_16145 [Limisphaerales bacterium]
MTPIVWTYIVYIALSIPLTIWVAQTLHKNGRIFLIDSFRGNERLADSVNHLLVVGFYLINIGYVALALKERIAPTDVREVFETISRKIGVVMLVLGAMHFFNILVFSKMRRRALLQAVPPPIPPQVHVNVAT